jgi:tetratricopeptide (TPR) repeat protein
VLTHDNLRSHHEAVQTLLGMSASIGDATRALAFLGNDVEKRFPLTAENRLQLAVLQFNAGRPEDANRLFASVAETQENLAALAEARYHTGQCEESARLMTAHLKAHPGATAEDWLFLGDLYEELGRFDEARKAYDYSLALLTANLPDTASSTPTGAQ